MSGAKRDFYDAIVIGVGGMGSAACYHLARRGARVLGLERFDIPHTMGSSHGFTRIIRLAYYEDSSYVPLLKRAFALWQELEHTSGQSLLKVTGSIDTGAPEDFVFAGSLASCLEHGLPHDILTSAQLTERYPGYRLPAGHMALFQPQGGFLTPEACIIAHVEGAQAAGAEIHAREPVLDWENGPGGVTVHTEQGEYHAAQLVIAAGAWAGKLSPDLAPLTQPERQVLAWFQPLEPALFQPENFPVFNLTAPEGRFYGFPIYGVPGFKFGQYHHLAEHVNPDDFAREPNARDESLLRGAVERYFPAAAGPTMALRTCLFTNTPDEHFIIDRAPGQPNVLLVSPCSGHGFKFCSVIGEIVADLVERDETAHDISLLRLDRLLTANAS